MIALVGPRERDAKTFERLCRFAHLHGHAAEILLLVVLQAGLPRLLVHDELPSLGIYPNKQGVIAFGDIEPGSFRSRSVCRAVALLAPARQTALNGTSSPKITRLRMDGAL